MRAWAIEHCGHLAGLVTAVLAVRSWFSPGRFVAAGDIGPFVREGLALDVGTAWGYGITGTGSVTAEVARLPELVAYRAVTGLGGSAMLAQQCFYVAVLATAASGIVFAVRRLGAGPLARAVVAVLAIANPLLAVNLPNPLVPVAVGTLGFLLGCLLDVVRGRGSVTATVVATLPLAYLSINPPTLAVVAGAALAGIAVALFRPGMRTNVWRHGRWAVPAAVAAHAWWLVPTVLLHTTGGSAEVAAVTDPAAWSWTHVNNSIANVVTLTAHWGWGQHEYLPFSRQLDRYPLSAARWALPALVLVGPVVAATSRARRSAFVALAVVAGAVVAAKGLHGPGEDLNRFLYELPGMWLLREPMSKVGPVLLVAYLVAVAAAVDGVVARTSTAHRRSRPHAVAGRVGAAGLALAALAFGSPVLTGGVAPENRMPLPSSRVQLPDSWTDLAAAVDADPTPGKVLVLPRLPFYQATTDWGFHGVATLPRDLFRRPVLLDLPGGYFGEQATVKDLVAAVEHGRSAEVLARALDSLDVSHVVVRRDLSDAQAVKPVASTDALLARLEGSGVFRPGRDYEVAVLLAVRAPRTGPSVDRPIATAAGPAGVGITVTAIETGAAVVGDASAPAGAAVLDGAGTTTLAAPGPGRYRIGADTTIARSFTVTARPGGLRLDDALSVSVDGRVAVASDDLVLSAPGSATPPAMLVDGRIVPLATGDEIDLPASARLAALAPTGMRRSVTGWSAVGDCARSDDDEPALDASYDGSTVHLTASAHAACVNAVPGLRGPVLVRASVDVRRGEGRMCLWSEASQRCAWDQRFGPGTASVELPVDVPRDGRLFLYADAATSPADVTFDDLTFQRLRSGSSVSVPSQFASRRLSLGAGEHAVRVSMRRSARRLGAPSDVGNCHDRGDDPQLGGEWDGRTLQLRAGGGAACVYLPVTGMQPEVPYSIAFDYRTDHAPGRFCLWLELARRCANDEQSLPASDTWRTHRSTVVLNAVDAGEDVRLYLYADAPDGPGRRIAVNEYRHLRLAPPTPVSVSLLSADDVPVAQLIGAAGRGDRWEAHVRSSGSQFVLSLPDSHHEGWTLHGVPDGVRAEPVVVDGFRQGWLVDAPEGSTMRLVAAFQPSTWTRAAGWLSGGGIVLLLLGASASGGRRPTASWRPGRWAQPWHRWSRKPSPSRIRSRTEVFVE